MENEKTPEQNASELGREFSKLGASKGGNARASMLSPAERSEIARNAVKARWAKAGKPAAPPPAEPPGSSPPASGTSPSSPRPGDLPTSMYRGTLQIGNLKVECHVLDDLRRVLTQREIVRILGAGRESGDISRYLDANPLLDQDLVLGQIIQFRVPGTQFIAHGFEGTLLVDICTSYLEAAEQGKLPRPIQQKAVVLQAGIVVRACAKTGIIALIDEATGYQKVRAKRALQLKLQAFIADEMQDWAKMFPEQFWQQLARLEGIGYSPRARPLRWGRYVMMFVYDAVDPDVGRELRRKNPDPHFMRNHHQWLKRFGRHRVEIQIEKVMTVMTLCRDMPDFRAKFAHVFKKAPLQLTFDDISEDGAAA